MRLLLDTNVLIDHIESRKPYCAAVRKLFVGQALGDFQLWACTQSFADAYYILSRNAPQAHVKSALSNLLLLIKPCNTYASDLDPALKSDWPDIEDFMIASCIKHVDATYLITRDKEMLKRLPHKAKTASEFLDLLEAEKGITYEELRLDTRGMDKS
jgi:predicted nucleic acid-binding protein